MVDKFYSKVGEQREWVGYWVCRKCQKTFKTERGLLIHFVRIHEGRKWISNRHPIGSKSYPRDRKSPLTRKEKNQILKSFNKGKGATREEIANKIHKSYGAVANYLHIKGMGRGYGKRKRKMVKVALKDWRKVAKALGNRQILGNRLSRRERVVDLTSDISKRSVLLKMFMDGEISETELRQYLKR